MRASEAAWVVEQVLKQAGVEAFVESIEHDTEILRTIGGGMHIMEPREVVVKVVVTGFRPSGSYFDTMKRVGGTD
jgi:hypothetical protein